MSFSFVPSTPTDGMTPEEVERTVRQHPKKFDCIEEAQAHPLFRRFFQFSVAHMDGDVVLCALEELYEYGLCPILTPGERVSQQMKREHAEPHIQRGLMLGDPTICEMVGEDRRELEERMCSITDEFVEACREERRLWLLEHFMHILEWVQYNTWDGEEVEASAGREWEEDYKRRVFSGLVVWRMWEFRREWAYDDLLAGPARLSSEMRYAALLLTQVLEQPHQVQAWCDEMSCEDPDNRRVGLSMQKALLMASSQDAVDAFMCTSFSNRLQQMEREFDEFQRWKAAREQKKHEASQASSQASGGEADQGTSDQDITTRRRGSWGDGVWDLEDDEEEEDDSGDECFVSSGEEEDEEDEDVCMCMTF